jgi:hypothetical protein
MISYLLVVAVVAIRCFSVQGHQSFGDGTILQNIFTGGIVAKGSI